MARAQSLTRRSLLRVTSSLGARSSPCVRCAHSAAAAESERSSALFCDDRRRKSVLDAMIRVDHAGELGARQIYAGQLSVFRGTAVGNTIEEMARQEEKHLNAFNRLISERRVRPTALMPVWNFAGYVLGAGTALLGREAAMACTVAVEEVIADHYNDQVRTLSDAERFGGEFDESKLRAMFREFRDDELEHKHIGLEHDAELAPQYRNLSRVIQWGCRAAIALTERV